MWWNYILFCIFAANLTSAVSGYSSQIYPNTIPIVGFFHNENSEQELAFKLTTKKVNLDKALLPNVILDPYIEHISAYDSFNISKRLCKLAGGGIGGVFGPKSLMTTGIVHSLSTVLDMPHIETHWDISDAPAASTINLFPDPQLLTEALVQVVQDMDWATFTVIYEQEDALLRIQGLLKAHPTLTPEGHVPFTVWQLTEEEDQRPLLKEIHNTSSSSRIILDCSTERILSVLHQARQVGMMTDYFTYILTSLDAHTLNYEEFKDQAPNMANITTLRLVNPLKHQVQAAVHDWVFEEQRAGRTLALSPENVTTEAGLMHDAVILYAKALYGLGQEIETEQLNCESRRGWNQGYSIVNYMKRVDFEGMTGRMKFDHETGRRTFFTLEITELTSSGFRKIGSWDPENGINYTRSVHDINREMFLAISNKTFIVASRLGEPFLKMADGWENLQGNDRFEGFSKQLIHEISEILGFKYEFRLVADKAYGSYDKKTKQWNGLIRELRDRKADLALCDLTITYERRSAVDFTMPFMTLGISILYSKPVKEKPSLFSFLSPFSPRVWMYVATAYLGISLLLYFLSRTSPYEWENPHPCNQQNEELECNYSLHNCLWFSIGSLMGQGCDILPKAISTRTLAGMWWFFVLIMNSSYTANLAAFLTTDKMDVSINNVQDLAKQSKIKYGVLKGGSSASFFRDSKDGMYQKIWSVMESTRPSVFVDTNDEGVERVLKGNKQYAYFMESTSIEYQVERHCELTQIGNLLDSKGYGIAMPFQFPYRSAISGAVLKLQELGRLQVIKDRWWKEMNSGPPCPDRGKVEPPSNELGMSHVGGVFVVLVVGCSGAFLGSILEFLWNVRKVAREEKISPKEAFMLELKFALSCHETTKEVRKARSEDGEDHSQLTYLTPDTPDPPKNDLL